MNVLIIDEINNNSWEKLKEFSEKSKNEKCVYTNLNDIINIYFLNSRIALAKVGVLDEVITSSTNICEILQKKIAEGKCCKASDPNGCNNKEKPLSSFDYIIWHPGGLNYIKEYICLYNCETDLQNRPPIIFVSKGGSWEDAKAARNVLYWLINMILKKKNSHVIKYLAAALGCFYFIQLKQMLQKLNESEECIRERETVNASKAKKSIEKTMELIEKTMGENKKCGNLKEKCGTLINKMEELKSEDESKLKNLDEIIKEIMICLNLTRFFENGNIFK